ncbi:MAG: ABC transporter permease [Clostridiales bacterium]|nr:ABC transporter permease [Clostridiales bacterium]
MTFPAACAALAAAVSLYGAGRLSVVVLEPVRVAVADNDKSAESAMMTQMLENFSDYLVAVPAESEEAAVEMTRAGEVSAAVVLPKNFAEGIKSGENQPFTLVTNAREPLKEAVLRRFAESFADMLSGAQGGVYAALDYAAERNPESYNKVFTEVNLRFLNLAVNRADLLKTRYAPPAFIITPAAHYRLGLWIFFNIMGTTLFFDIFTENFTERATRRIIQETNAARFAGEAVLAVFACLLVINAAAAPFVLEKAPERALQAAAFLLAVAAGGVLLCVCVKSAPAACAIVSAADLAAFFASGGVVPPEFLSAPVRAFGGLTLNGRAYEALARGGGAAGLLVYAAAFYAAAVLVIYRKNCERGYYEIFRRVVHNKL